MNIFSFYFCLQGETFVWVNGASAHSQTVAKAKYDFLFGESENETTSESGKHQCFYSEAIFISSLIIQYTYSIILT